MQKYLPAASVKRGIDDGNQVKGTLSSREKGGVGVEVCFLFVYMNNCLLTTCPIGKSDYSNGIENDKLSDVPQECQRFGLNFCFLKNRIFSSNISQNHHILEHI